MRLRSYVAATLLATTALSGCYRYVPAPESPARGMAVRAYLTQPLQVPLTDITANNVTAVEGEVAVASRDTLYLSASRLFAPGGAEFLPMGETVAIPRLSLGNVQLRKVDTLGTSVSILGGIGLAILASLLLTDELSGGERNPPPQQPQ